MRSALRLALGMLLLVCVLLAGCTPVSPGVSPTAATVPAAVLTPEPSTLPSPDSTGPAAEAPIRYGVLDQCAAQFLGENLVYYQGLVEAVLARAQTYTLPRDCSLSPWGLWSVFHFYSPLDAFVTDATYLDDQRSLTFRYRFEPGDHAQAVAALSQGFAESLETARGGDYNTLEQVLLVYRYFAIRFSYDYDYDPNQGEDLSVYDALQTGYGVCHTYANACKFALLQLGIPVEEGRAINDAGEHHAWFLAQINGVWYHFDPTFENGETGGRGLAFFAMTDDERAERGDYIAPYPVGIYPWNDSAPRCAADRFALFRAVVDFDWIGAHTLLLHRGEGATLYYRTDTGAGRAAS